MSKNNILIYGSYGYSGNLIAELACKQGLKPVLAGRNLDKLREQAARLGLQYRHFDITDFDTAKNNLKEFVAVVHCAGPFIKTYNNMAQACIETGTHYLDITGEYNVIESLSKMHQQASNAEIMLLPGAGFDVVPSDCLALYLKNELPDATQLTLAIHFSKHTKDAATIISRGTAKTMVEGLAQGSMIRDQGVLTPIPLGWKKRFFKFGDQKSICCTTISWGDLASAWWSTHIPHIETYMSTPAKTITMYRLLSPIKVIFKWSLVKQYLLNRIDKMSAGPSEQELKNSIVKIYGEVLNAQGNKVAAVVQTPNAYEFTALSVMTIVNKVLAGQAPVGFQTPATAYGADLVLEIPATMRSKVKN
jgi:short subunit dehydrogenase-like uncharacterized protein